MPKYSLVLPELLHPLWVRAVVSKGDFEVDVTPAGTVVVDRQELSFREGASPAPGSKLMCRLLGHLTCVTVEEYKEGLRKQALAANANPSTEASKSERKRAKAKAFHESYAFPFTWRVAIKERVRALSPLGGGATRATVVHLQLEEDYSSARFQRKRGDLLCQPYRLSAAWNTSGQAHKGLAAYTEGGDEYSEPVSCKACLRAAARWRKN